MAKMTREELEQFVAHEFPQASGFATIEHVGDDGAVRLRAAVDDTHLRPGGTVSGPVLMTLADTAIYYSVLAMSGPVALAVTTSLNINFLRRPAPRDLIAHSSLLKLGKRLAVGQVTIESDGEPRPIAHATVTYSLPPRA